MNNKPLSYIEKNIIARDALILNALSDNPSWDIKVDKISKYHTFFISAKDINIYREMYILDAHANLLNFFIKNAESLDEKGLTPLNQIKIPIPLMKNSIIVLNKAIAYALPTIDAKEQKKYSDGCQAFIKALFYYNNEVCTSFSSYVSLEGSKDIKSIFGSNYYHVNRKNKRIFEDKYFNFIKMIKNNSSILLSFIEKISIDKILQELFDKTLKEKFQNQENKESSIGDLRKYIKFFEEDGSSPMRIDNTASSDGMSFWIDIQGTDRPAISFNKLSIKHPFSLGSIAIIEHLLKEEEINFYGDCKYIPLYRRIRAYHLAKKSDKRKKEIEKTLLLVSEEIKSIDMIVDQELIVDRKSKSLTSVAIKGDIQAFKNIFKTEVLNSFEAFLIAESEKKELSVFRKQTSNFSYVSSYYFIEKTVAIHGELLPYSNKIDEQNAINNIVKKHIHKLLIEMIKMYIRYRNKYIQEHHEEIHSDKEEVFKEKKSEEKKEDKSIDEKSKENSNTEQVISDEPITMDETMLAVLEEGIEDDIKDESRIIDVDKTDNTSTQKDDTDGYNTTEDTEDTEDFNELDEIGLLQEDE